jgi:septal ring factor EnvC (AmiA/AmiB activator)
VKKITKAQIEELQRKAAARREDRIRAEEKFETLRKQAEDLKQEIESTYGMSIGEALKEVEKQEKQLRKDIEAAEKKLKEVA